MTAAVAIALLAAVAAFVVFPLLRSVRDVETAEATGTSELWSREKAVAVLAITEADFDRATGKLSEGDYQVLRSDYESRALHAMDELEKAADPGTGLHRFCGSCGASFAGADLFCGRCGSRRNVS